VILIRFDNKGLKHLVDVTDIYQGQTAFLVGGAPSLKEQPIHRLEERGVITMAMNNVAMHFRPTMWISGDNPNCYQPRIIGDPTLFKLAPYVHANANVDALKLKYRQLPGMNYYLQETNVPWDEYLALRRGVPWYSNTLFAAIHVLYQLGIRRIILAGSDFGFSKDGGMYAHDVKYGDLEKKWNLDLYNSQVRELRMLKNIFDTAGLELLDCSVNSRIKQTYWHITMDEGVEMCLSSLPRDWKPSAELPHASKFAPYSIHERIASWPGHNAVDLAITMPETKPEVLESQTVPPVPEGTT